MEISFFKKESPFHVLSCKRNDGSITWMNCTDFFVLHDFCHYAVETKLDLKRGFYGMLAAGISITDFELPKEQRIFELTDEAIFAEHIVNLLCIEYHQGEVENFKEIITQSYTAKNNLVNKITDKTVSAFREESKLLMNNWNLLSINESMLLQFEL